MPGPSKRTLQQVGRALDAAVGVRPRLLDLSGRTVAGRDPLAALPRVRRERAYALQESVNLGAPYFFHLGPGLQSWLVALENGRIIHGALLGPEVLCAEDNASRAEASAHLVELGLSPRAAADFVRRLPVWPAARIRDAAAACSDTFYRLSGWQAVQMEENRLRHQLQQQIATAVEDQKQRGEPAAYPFEKERVLLSLIRAGDSPGARRVLNEMLGAMYLSSPRLVVLRARAIEMMGYLTRAAVEDSPVLEPLIERNHHWMEQLIRARDFEELCRVLTDALNDFIEGIYLHGFNRSNVHVTRALDFVTRHYAKPLRLKEIAGHVGLSTFRIAHLVKTHTGKSLVQVINHARIQAACHLLENSTKSCTEIGYEVGYSDQSYFTRHFRRLTGTTPARYRRTGALRPRG
jgi:AraC-like DNA-binding protein